VRIVYVLPSRHGLALSQFERNNVNVAPNYNLLHWCPPHVNGVVFAELDSFDIRGMSAMIYRAVPHHRIRYILGATGEGRRRLRRSPMRELDSMDYVFIDSDETVRAWLLSNPVLDDPLPLMVYCYRDRGSERQDTPALRRVDYLNQNDVRNWAHDPAQRIGQMHSRELFDDRPGDREGRVRYGADGAPKNAGPRPFSPPHPTQRPGAGCLFRHSLPLSPLRPPPHPIPQTGPR